MKASLVLRSRSKDPTNEHDQPQDRIPLQFCWDSEEPDPTDT